MNRLHHLKMTLRRNITDNEDYENIEFVLLDYSSTDNLKEWVYINFREELIFKKIVFIGCPGKIIFSHSHSKNIAFKMATGDIVCSINADHFTGKGFASFVNREFQFNKNIVLTTIDQHKTERKFLPAKDVLGKVCVLKKDFINIRGFDESMTTYGFEDWDLVSRLEILGKKRVLIKQKKFLSFISHPDHERFDILENNGAEIFIKQISMSRSSILILYQNHTFKKGVLVDNLLECATNYETGISGGNYLFDYEILNLDWLEGKWSLINQELILIKCLDENIHYFKLVNSDTQILESLTNNDHYIKLLNTQNILDLLRFDYMLKTRNIFQNNLQKKILKPNRNKFGYGRVVDYNQDII